MSEIKVNKISPKQTCTQLTLGDSGDTIIIPAGATIQNSGTATGFGRTGTVNWDTTKKTTGFTAVNGSGYFCDTTSAAFTATLPATPTAGDIVAFSDYTGTWATNNLTIGRNGSNINAAASNLILNVNDTTATFIYVDATEGWRVIDTGALTEVNVTRYVAATGGTVLTCGDYKTHVFTGPGTFTVSCAGNSIGSNSVEYLVVAGGGAGGTDIGGGGGAGGYRQNYPSPATAGLPVTATAYPITVGAGGAAFAAHTRQIYTPGVNALGNSGSNSIFSTITSAGGGGGGAYNGGVTGNPSQPQATPGANGGSGGGQGVDSSGCNVRTQPGTSGGSGNTPPVSPPQGNPGGTGWNSPWNSAGGGGAGAAGANASSGANTAGAGGAGSPIATAFFGPTSPSYGTPGPAPGRYFAGGGGGTTYGNAEPDAGTVQVAGGSGGGGPGGRRTPLTAGTAGTANTGGGGGGAGFSNSASPDVAASGAGGSGIVVIRYKFQ